MDPKLRIAAIHGDTGSLRELLNKNPYVLDESYVNDGDKNVLHITAMLGHEGFVKEILQTGSSSVRAMCFARDRDGINPVQLAAVHGKLNILELMDRYDELMQAALEKLDDGCTILHLCVKHNQLEALDLLIKRFGTGKKLIVEAKNNDGMTILHLALKNNLNQRRSKIIVYLIKNEPHIINMKDASGDTALDFCFQQDKKYETEVGRAFLESEDADTNFFLDRSFLKNLKDNRGAILVAASIIATVAYQAMINPPGGVWQDDSSKTDNSTHFAGESVMAKNHSDQYADLVFYFTAALISSVSTIFLDLISGLLLSNNLFMETMVVFTEYAFIFSSGIFIMVAYGFSFSTIVPVSSKWHMEPAKVSTSILALVILSPLLIYVAVLLINNTVHKVYVHFNKQHTSIPSSGRLI